MLNFINSRFGTYRGLIRLLLSYRAYRSRTAISQDPNITGAKRLVFVCLGNICRSPFGELVAAQKGLRTASFGLSTTTGVKANPEGVAAATRAGYELHAHRATDLTDFTPLANDLYLLMEVGQIARLKQDPRFAKLSSAMLLLGNLCQPPRPHLHDPHHLSPAYFDTCYRLIDEAVETLATLCPLAKR
ncbi:MAG: hypothetical protein RLZZ502_1715 [Pseudomonadota bacterium]|jgi:protein-tyrosine phosphatase